MFEWQPLAPLAPPITTDMEYEAAVAEVEPLLASEPAEGTPKYLRTMALVGSIEAYEAAHGWNMGDCSNTDYEAFKQEQRGYGCAAPVTLKSRMRIVALSTLRAFCEAHADAKDDSKEGKRIF